MAIKGKPLTAAYLRKQDVITRRMLAHSRRRLQQLEYLKPAASPKERKRRANEKRIVRRLITLYERAIRNFRLIIRDYR